LLHFQCKQHTTALNPNSILLHFQYKQQTTALNPNSILIYFQYKQHTTELNPNSILIYFQYKQHTTAINPNAILLNFRPTNITQQSMKFDQTEKSVIVTDLQRKSGGKRLRVYLHAMQHITTAAM
jgi:hypothetical protein